MGKSIKDTALIFEGGGMRASYTAAAANVLLENGLFFENVYGVSAGSSNAVNYLSGDNERTRQSFTDFADDPQFGGLSSFLLHKGMFNARYIYQEAGLPEGRFPFDMKSFLANPARVTVEGFNRDTGETIYWTKDDLSTLEKLMVRVRASSSLPLAMVPTRVDDCWCYDGGLGEGAGMMLAKAKSDGFERFFVICTRPRGFRKAERRNAMVERLFWRRPFVQEALATRPERYNRELDELEALEAEGRALVFYAEEQAVENSERSSAKLRANYEKGYAQACAEIEQWSLFLGL